MARPLLCLAEEQEGAAEIPVETVAIIDADERGEPLRFPSCVFFDKTMEEIYLINGGSGRVIVYGRDYFPLVSIGAGRGIQAPQGVYVDDGGLVYICQGRTADKPPRISIYNAAFLPLKEISIDDIPEAEGFIPRRVAVSAEGTMYVAGHGRRGVLVLDQDGTFLRWLRPMDRIADKEAIAAARAEQEEKSQEKEKAAAEETTISPFIDLPEQFRPKSKKEKEEEIEVGRGPVQIIEVVIDSEGHIYLLSEETSKVYVYSPNETFLYSFGQKGGSSGKMSRPRGLAVDEQRKAVYIVDYMRHTVLIYDLAGKFMYEFGGMGRSPGWFSFPTSIALNRQGQLIVADLFNQRLQVIEVQFKSQFPFFRPESGKQPAPGAIEEEPLPEEAKPHESQ